MKYDFGVMLRFSIAAETHAAAIINAARSLEKAGFPPFYIHYDEPMPGDFDKEMYDQLPTRDAVPIIEQLPT